MSVANSFERQMLELINQERTSRGIAPLTLELRLNDASEDHSIWMDQTLNFSHTGIGGSNPGDRMRDAGFVFSGSWAWGENIAYQSERNAPGISDDVVDLHNGLMNSSGHRANILNPNFEVIGIGIEVGYNRGFEAVYVTQKFAKTSAPLQLDEPQAQNSPPPLPPEDTDPFSGNQSNNVLEGDGGNNLLSGFGGSDTISGGNGNDRIIAGSGHDHVFGDSGNDEIIGGAGHDRLGGGWGRDTMTGGAGDDQLNAGTGADLLVGGTGDDRLVGGGGSDTLIGGDGNDVLIGGGGSDTFVFSTGQDVVTDFDPARDGEVIDLRGVASITGSDDLFTGGHLRPSGNATIIDDLNGNTLELRGVSLSELQVDDFVF